MVPLATGGSPPSTRVLVGGASARSSIPYWVLAIFSLILKVELVSGFEFPLRHGIGALAVVVAALFGAKFVLDRTVFRGGDDRPVAMWGVVLIGLLLGVVTVLPFIVALRIAGEDLTTQPIPGLMLAGVLRSGMLFPVAAYLVGLRRWYGTARRAAERELVQAETARIEAGDDVEATRTLIIETARREIGPSQREASDLLGVAARSEAPDDLSRAAASLRSAARSAVRSTSHELWVDDGTAATIRWRSIVPASLVRYPLPLLLPVLTIVGSTVVRAYPRSSPGVVAVLAAAVVIAVAGAVYLLGRAVIARFPAAAAGVTAVAVAVASLLGQFAASVVSDRTVGVISMLVIMVVTGLFTIASSVVLMVRDSGAAVVQSLVDDRARADAQQAALEMMNKRLSRELASHLHGTMQPQLLAASVALDGAVNSDDPRAIANAVAQAEAALGLEVRPPAREAPPVLDDLVAGLTERWRAMLEIAVHVDAAPGDALPVGVARALDECLNNAVIHGCATRAEVRITHAADGWHIEVADDGTGPAGGAPGLGSSVLDELTGGAWSLAPGGHGGTVVRAHVPHRAAATAN